MLHPHHLGPRLTHLFSLLLVLSSLLILHHLHSLPGSQDTVLIPLCLHWVWSHKQQQHDILLQVTVLKVACIVLFIEGALSNRGVRVFSEWVEYPLLSSRFTDVVNSPKLSSSFLCFLLAHHSLTVGPSFIQTIPRHTTTRTMCQPYWDR